MSSSRQAEIKRKTNETDISILINIDGNGISEIDTGIPFLDHMLHQISSCLLYTSPSPRDRTRSRMPSSA